MRKLRGSQVLGITAVVIAVGGYYGIQAASRFALRNEHFNPVAPGRVNLVGIDPGAGYRIIVANDVAQLVETQGGFGGNESDSGGATEGSIKRRVPMRELLGVLRGDDKALGPFVMIMNGIRENEDWSPNRVLWKKADLDKAIAGDPVLKPRLERDLSVRLDGTPIAPLRLNSLEDGIFVVAPVEMTVDIDGKPTVVRGETMEPYKPAFIKGVEAQYKDKANVDNAVIAGYYAAEAQKLKEKPTGKEDVAGSLRRMVGKETMEARLAAPRRLLSSATVVLNEHQIESARYRNYKTNDGKPLNDLTVDLNDEGRKRLWKYTQGKVGNQILLIADDVAIAAPRIEHELALREFTITQMPDEVLVREAVDSIKGGSRTARR